MTYNNEGREWCAKGLEFFNQVANMKLKRGPWTPPLVGEEPQEDLAGKQRAREEMDRLADIHLTPHKPNDTKPEFPPMQCTQGLHSVRPTASLSLAIDPSTSQGHPPPPSRVPKLLVAEQPPQKPPLLPPQSFAPRRPESPRHGKPSGRHGSLTTRGRFVTPSLNELQVPRSSLTSAPTSLTTLAAPNGRPDTSHTLDPVPDGLNIGKGLRRELQQQYEGEGYLLQEESSESLWGSQIRFHFPKNSVDSEGQGSSAMPYLTYNYYDVKVRWSSDDAKFDVSNLSPALHDLRLHYSTKRKKLEGPGMLKELKHRFKTPKCWDKFAAKQLAQAQDLEALGAWAKSLVPRGIGDFKPMFILCQALLQDLMELCVDPLRNWANEKKRMREDIAALKGQVAERDRRLADIDDAVMRGDLVSPKERDQIYAVCDARRLRGGLLTLRGLDNVNDELARLRAQLAAMRAENEKLRADNAQLRGEIKALKADLAHLQREYAALEAAHARLREDYAALQAENEQLRADLEESRSENRRLRSENAALLAENDKLKAENAALKGEIAQLKGEIAQLKAENAALKAEIAQLKAENAALKAETAQLKGEIAQLKGELAQLKADCAALQAELERVQRELAAAIEQARLAEEAASSNVLVKYKYKILTIAPGNNAELLEKLRLLQEQLDAQEAELQGYRPMRKQYAGMMTAPDHVDKTTGMEEPAWVEELFGETGKWSKVVDYQSLQELIRLSVEYYSSEYTVEMISTEVRYDETLDEDDDGVDDDDTYDDNIFVVTHSSAFQRCDLALNDVIPKPHAIAQGHYDCANNRETGSHESFKVAPLMNRKQVTSVGHPVVNGTLTSFGEAESLHQEADQRGISTDQMRLHMDTVFDKVVVGIGKAMEHMYQYQEDVIASLEDHSEALNFTRKSRAAEPTVVEGEGLANLSMGVMARVTQFRNNMVRGGLMKERARLLAMMNKLLQDRRKLQEMMSTPLMINALTEVRRYPKPDPLVVTVMACLHCVLATPPVITAMPINEDTDLMEIPLDKPATALTFWKEFQHVKDTQVKLTVRRVMAASIQSLQDPHVELGPHARRRFEAAQCMLADVTFDQVMKKSRVVGIVQQWVMTMITLESANQHLEAIEADVQKLKPGTINE